MISVNIIQRIVRNIGEKASLTRSNDATWHPSKKILYTKSTINPEYIKSGFSFKLDPTYSEWTISVENQVLFNGNLKQTLNSNIKITKSLHNNYIDTPFGLSYQEEIYGIFSNNASIKITINLLKKEPIAIFEVEFLENLPGLDNQEKTNNVSNYDHLYGFPSFKTQISIFSGFTFKNKQFSPPTNSLGGRISAPICLYDSDANCLILSALNDFANNTISIEPAENINQDSLITVGPHKNIKSIPKGYKYAAVLILANGINNAFEKFGEILHQYSPISDRMKDPKECIMNSHLGYFTDHGAFYYYNPIPGTTYDETFRRFEKYYTEQEPVPFSYYHLDSWWYPKSIKTGIISKIMGRIFGGSKSGGCMLWEQDPKVWSTRLPDLSLQLHGKKFTAHARWFDANSPYTKTYPMIITNEWAMPTTLAFWQNIMTYAAQNHIILYEQDWMENQFTHFDHLQNELGEQRKWLEQMNQAAKEHGISIQYCMATPSQWLEAAKLSQVFNFRTTADYHSNADLRLYLPQFTQNSLLSNAIGISPFIDVIYSNGFGQPATDELYAELKAMVSMMGRAVFTLGDPIGNVNQPIVTATTRSDGRLYHADRAATALDMMYIPHKTCYITSTETYHQAFTIFYVLFMHLFPDDLKSFDFSIFELKKGIQDTSFSQYAQFNWNSRTVLRIDKNELVKIDLMEKKYQFNIYTPILPNGVAIIGNPDHYITLNHVEFLNIDYDFSAREIKISISGIINQKMKIWIYSTNGQMQLKINENMEKFTEISENIYEIKIEFETETKKVIRIAN